MLSVIDQTLVQPREVNLEDIRRVDESISKFPPSESEVSVVFTPGMVSREIRMQPGSRHRSKIHKVKHQFVISAGACIVSENGGPEYMAIAPYRAVTEPGTWRELFIILPTVWTTFHPTDKTTLEEAERDLIANEEDSK